MAATFHVKQIQKELADEIRRAILGFGGTARGAHMLGARSTVKIEPDGSTITLNVNAVDAFGVVIKIRST